MSFQVFNTTMNKQRCLRWAGYAVLSGQGQVTMVRSDLEKVGIDKSVVLLVDPELRRLGLRRPRDTDEDRAVARTFRSINGGKAFRLSMQGALTSIGVRWQAIGPRWPQRTLCVELAVKDDLLILQFPSNDKWTDT